MTDEEKRAYETTIEEMIAQNRLVCAECGFVFSKENQKKLQEDQRVIHLVSFATKDGEGRVIPFCNFCIEEIKNKYELKKD